MSEVSDILIEKLAVEEVGERSHLFLFLGNTEEYSENFHSKHDGAWYSWGKFIGEETDTHEENDKNKEENYYKTQVSFKARPKNNICPSTHRLAPSDHLGNVKTLTTACF